MDVPGPVIFVPVAGRRSLSAVAEAVPSYTDEDLRNFEEEGQVDLKMPGFRKTLTRQDLDDIIAHIRTWQTAAR